MNKNLAFLHTAVALAVLIPVPARLAYGLVILLCFNFLMLFSTLISKLLDVLSLNNMRPACLIIALICLTVCFRQLVIFYSPIIGLTLGFVLYLPVIAVLIVGDCLDNFNTSLKDSLRQNMLEALRFSFYGIVFFLLRDILGYGTFTLPIPDGILKLHLPQFLFSTSSVFWASIPGGIILVGLFLALMTVVKKKNKIINRSSDLQEQIDV
ncbi:MAG: hypothetical protein J6B81_02300 [Spirochaetaceae bacterium]|nr:hypothetical protein [Spirochaetaceae bacterium]